MCGRSAETRGDRPRERFRLVVRGETLELRTDWRLVKRSFLVLLIGGGVLVAAIGGRDLVANLLGLI